MSDYSNTNDANSEILVSVSCTSFNHGEYIRRCIEGFLMQKTNFEFEILIHDDASTDNTQEIIKEFWAKYPDRVKPILQTENQYSKGERGMMLRFNFPRARGKYIAICEGDDYWSDPEKLQKQVDFLEQNPDYVLCFHDVHVLLSSGELKSDFITKIPEDYQDLATLAKVGNYIHTPSVIFRNQVQNMPAYALKATTGDYFLYCYLGQFGKFKHLNESMAVYRYGVGVWSQNDEFTRLFSTQITNCYLAKYFSEQGHDKIADLFIDRICEFIKNNIKQIEKSHIEKLAIIPSINLHISITLLEERSKLQNTLLRIKPSIVDNVSVGRLVGIVCQRIMKKISKGFKK